MGLFGSLAGQIRVELTGADIAGSMAAVSEANIAVYLIQFSDDLTVSFTIQRKDYGRLAGLAQKKGDRLRILGRKGLYWTLRSAFSRPVLIFGLLLLLAFAFWVPSRVFIIEVEGNETIPKQLIVESAAESGIRFGASRRLVRSEQMKNQLLAIMPELQWAGVNTYGCRAVITVREREQSETETDEKTVSSVVASRDGIITSCTVTRGSGLCSTGQAVREGEVLISGYTDCGITITATHAEGEVMASTLRDLTVKTPDHWLIRQEETESNRKYSLVIGKKRINFYKGSGISGGSCVKMYTEYVLTLPGGFELPVKLLVQTFSDYRTKQAAVENAEELLQSFAQQYLKEQMVAGSIQYASQTVVGSDGAYCLTGRYTCTEMIGIDREEMIGEFNGKTDGTDRERGSGG